MFTLWLYRDSTPEIRQCPDADVFIVEAYLFAQRRGCPDYETHIMNALSLSWRSRRPSSAAIILALDESLPGSKLRKFIIEKYAWYGEDTRHSWASKYVVSAWDSFKVAFGVYRALFTPIFEWW
jgi:hypothetical protein